MRAAKLFGLAVALTAVLGCSARTDKTDSGGIILSISDLDFSNLTEPLSVSGTYPTAQGNSIEVQSIVVNPGQGTSDLMKVEMQGYEITYERLDTGTRVPPRLVQNVFGTVDPGGTFTLSNFTIFALDQYNTQPFKDFLDFGKDTETNSTVIRLKLGIRFFGKTLSGDRVESQIAPFTINIVG